MRKALRRIGLPHPVAARIIKFAQQQADDFGFFRQRKAGGFMDDERTPGKKRAAGQPDRE